MNCICACSILKVELGKLLLYIHQPSHLQNEVLRRSSHIGKPEPEDQATCEDAEGVQKCGAHKQDLSVSSIHETYLRKCELSEFWCLFPLHQCSCRWDTCCKRLREDETSLSCIEWSLRHHWVSSWWTEVSSRYYRTAQHNPMQKWHRNVVFIHETYLIDISSHWTTQHCSSAIESEKETKQLILTSLW